MVNRSSVATWSRTFGGLLLVLAGCPAEPNDPPGSGTEGSDTGDDGGPDAGPDVDSTGDGGDDVEPTTSPVTTEPDPVCGNGIVEGIEQCDDMNDIPADGCEIDCTTTYDTLIWELSYDGGANLRDAAHGVAIDSAGNPVIVGYVVPEVGNPDIFVRKYDPRGNEIWTTVLDPSMGGEDRAWAIAIDADDNVLVTGESDTAPALADLWIGKLDPGGTLLWTDAVAGPQEGDDGGRGIAVDDMGYAAVAGFLRTGTNDNDIFVGLWSPDGVLDWSDTIPGPDGLDDRGMGVAFDSTGALVVAGFISYEGFNRDIWVRKYDVTGVEEWTFTWDSDQSGDDAAYAVAIAPDDTIGVTGTTPIIATNEDVWLGKLDPDGSLVWWRRFGAPATLDDNGLGITSNADGDFIVAGFKSLSATDTDIYMRKYDAGANEIWTQSRGGRGGVIDEARAIVADANGDLYVTGEIRATDTNDGDIWLGKFAP